MVSTISSEKNSMPQIIEELPRPASGVNNNNWNDRNFQQYATSLRENEKLRKWGYFLFCVNSFILVIASSLIIIVLNLANYWSYFEPFLLIYTDSPGLTLIVMSCILIAMSIFTYYIAYCKKYFLWLAIALIMMIIFETRFVVAGYLYLDKAREHVGNELWHAMNMYSTDMYLKSSVDILQTTLKCCGKDENEDWFETHTNYTPASCCPSSVNGETVDCRLPDLITLHLEPCLPKLLEIPELGIDVIFSVLGIIVLLEVIMLLVLRIMAIISQRCRR